MQHEKGNKSFNLENNVIKLQSQVDWVRKFIVFCQSFDDELNPTFPIYFLLTIKLKLKRMAVSLIRSHLSLCIF